MINVMSSGIRICKTRRLEYSVGLDRGIFSENGCCYYLLAVPAEQRLHIIRTMIFIIFIVIPQ